MTRTRSTRRLVGGLVAMVLGTVLFVGALVAPPAGAGFAQLRAEIGCDRVVRWSATASPGTDAERTNPTVFVEYRVDDGDDDGSDGDGGGWTVVGPAFAFSPESGFSASGEFAVPDDAGTLALRVRPDAPWESGDPAGDPRYATVAVPEGCAAAPIALQRSSDCARSALAVTARSLGSEPLPLVLRLDGAIVHTGRIDAGAQTTTLIPLVDGAPARLRAESASVTLFDGDVALGCDHGGAVAVVQRKCSPDAAVLLARAGDTPTAVEVHLDGVLAVRETVAAATVLRFAMTPPGAASGVEVQLDGVTVASGPLGECTGDVAGVAFCADPAGCPRTGGDALDAPAQISAEPAIEELPRTGPWQRAVVMLAAAAALFAGGSATVVSDRVIPRPSLLARSVASYRRGWWSEP